MLVGSHPLPAQFDRDAVAQEAPHVSSGDSVARFQYHDGPTGCHECSGGAETGQTCTHDDYVNVAHFHTSS
nr:hypothetical protein GCM10017611_73770 [Rhodococcus wratislaviensis]